ncbi:hypothetical protein HK101_007147 [Irineochytrium annulatum]|nr:hypothetical protein HK101_007147 [Irineochytrium annulatum]
MTKFITEVLGVSDFRAVRWNKANKDRLINNMLSKARIQVNHRGDMKRKYRFNRVTEQNSHQAHFKVEHDGKSEEITVYEFFKTHYGRTLTYPDAPCLCVGPASKENMLPIEVCDIPQGQPFVRKLNSDQTANMITFTCLKPSERMNDINAGFKEMIATDNEFITEFGLAISDSPAEIPARILPYPRVKYGGSGPDAILTRKEIAEGAWNLRNKSVTIPIELKSWAVVNLSRIDDADVQAFITEFVKTGKRMGIRFKLERPPMIKVRPEGDVRKAILEVGKRALDDNKTPPTLIMIVLPDKGTELYKRIKLTADTSHVKKRNVQYLANVLIKINAKLEGLNQSVAPDSIKFFADKPTMIFGADVAHPAPGQSVKPSIAAVVGSLDREFCRYASRFSIQRQREMIGAGEDERKRGPSDTIEMIGQMVYELIKIFTDRNGCRPERLIFYRDGVASNQFREVLASELQPIQRACSLLHESYRPTITYIVVQKRHHVRLFPLSSNASDRSGNVLPGTVIDSHITHPSWFDFFLNSHAGIQGTSRPAHYTVIYDENSFSPNVLQTYTFNLCYEYAKATRSVSVCPPAYYAHLAAKRAALHFAGDDFDQSQSAGGSTPSFEFYSSKFRSVHSRIASTMYYI